MRQQLINKYITYFSDLPQTKLKFKYCLHHTCIIFVSIRMLVVLGVNANLDTTAMNQSNCCNKWHLNYKKASLMIHSIQF